MKNLLLENAQKAYVLIDELFKNLKNERNIIFQIKKSASSVYANIREAQYGQSPADMLSKFQIALKECNETEGWLQMLFDCKNITEFEFRNIRNTYGRIKRMLIASCKTLKDKFN